jgi:hypothetical protein
MTVYLICLAIVLACAGFALWRWHGRRHERQWLRRLLAQARARDDWRARMIEDQCFFRQDEEVPNPKP